MSLRLSKSFLKYWPKSNSATIISNMNKDAKIKDAILQYFSNSLQYDETPVAALKRYQLQKMLLEWARTESNVAEKSA